LWVRLVVLALALLAVAALVLTDGSPSVSKTFAATFTPKFGTTGLVTNEFAFRNPNDPASHLSPDWVVTSGSLFARNGAGWTGAPDRADPGAGSSNGTDSAVFRLVSRRRDFSGVHVAFQLFVQRHVVTPETENQSYDGVYVWLEYTSETRLYALSIMRWDGLTVIKRKTPGGPSNGGTYQTLAQAKSATPKGRWVPITVDSVNRSGGVNLSISVNGGQILQCFDPGGSALMGKGGIGIRGDNTEFQFRNFQARSS
jgi:hypothetical protein